MQWIKYNVRILAIKQDKKLAAHRKQTQMNIIAKNNPLCKGEALNDKEKEELLHLRSDLDQMFAEKANGAFIRSRAKWIEDGEKNYSYFFNLDDHRQKKNIRKLKINENLCDNQSDSIL